jgi:hypothetical protein
MSNAGFYHQRMSVEEASQVAWQWLAFEEGQLAAAWRVAHVTVQPCIMESYTEEVQHCAT